jgi:Rad52/22 family double-strand break repair protein
MGFSGKQLQALRRDLNVKSIRTRQANGRELCYIEGWHAIAEANRIFGFDGWDRETVESRCLMSRETRGTFLAVYAAKVRITVRANGRTIVREGHGSGEGRGTSPGETHDIALKGAETDATKRALATFGKPFGLALYLGGRRKEEAAANVQPAPAGAAPLERSLPSEIGSENMSPGQAILNRAVENNEGPALTARMDKSMLTFGAPRRLRDKDHLRFVASQPCLLCSRLPSDAHHLRFAQPVALGRKVSDEFTVPLCRIHHRQAHQAGNESAWWQDMGVDALEIARALWQESHANNTRGSVVYEPRSAGATRQSNPAPEIAGQANAAPQLPADPPVARR